MRYGWMFIIPTLAFFAVIGVLVLRAAKQKHKLRRNAALISHSASVKNLPEYQRARVIYFVLLGLALTAFIVSLISCTLLASRPVAVSVENSDFNNRDIMVCLDVSGSMSEYQADILNYYIDVAKNLKGQRVGVTIFDGGYFNLLPLTDDYAAVSDFLNALSKHFDDYRGMTYLTGVSSSRIGDGVVGCINSFDQLENSERSRMMLLATDNYAGEQTVTLTQAANYAKRFDIVIYGINIADYRSQERLENNQAYTYNDPDAEEFRQAVISTGGSYYAASKFADGQVVVLNDVISKIMQQEAARYQGAIRVVRNDAPQTVALIAASAVLVLILVLWRLKL